MQRCRTQGAPVAQLAEATDSKPVQCRFKSDRGHQIIAGKRRYPEFWVVPIFFSIRREYAVDLAAARAALSRVIRAKQAALNVAGALMDQQEIA